MNTIHQIGKGIQQEDGSQAITLFLKSLTSTKDTNTA